MSEKLALNIFKCNACVGKKRPCVLSVVDGSTGLGPPSNCPFGFEGSKWKKQGEGAVFEAREFN